MSKIISAINNQEQDTAPRERILQTAIKLFAKHGFAGTGLRELATEADVNLAMINYFYGSKKDLLKKILDDFFSGYIAIAQTELTANSTLHNKLAAFINHAVRYFDAQQNSLLVAITELPHDDQDIIEHKGSWARQMAAILEQEVCGQLNRETGLNIPATCIGPMLTSLMASRFLFAPVMDHVRDKAENPVDIKAYTEMILSIFLQGIEKQNSNSPQNGATHDNDEDYQKNRITV